MVKFHSLLWSFESGKVFLSTTDIRGQLLSFNGKNSDRSLRVFYNISIQIVISLSMIFGSV